LGDDSAIANRSLPTPIAAPGISFKAVSSGGDSTCAIEASFGTLYCWGYGEDGQLGFGDTTNRAIPEAIPFFGNSNFIAVATGSHTCAAHAISGNLSQSRLFCWGSNAFGQVGNGATGSNVLVPFDMGFNVAGGSDLSVPVSLGLGYGRTCAASSFFNFAACWGLNELGQLGDGTRIQREAAVISQLGQVRQLAAGQRHTCAIRTNGELVCTGDDTYGQLGDGVMGDALTPLVIPSFVAWSSTLFSDDFEGAP
jgi:alpha-tubulin suppressor-like RCC1 family protein